MNKQETETVLRDYAEELRENLNFRLFCEAKQDISLWKTIFPNQEILWVEDVVFAGITYPEEKKSKRGSRCKGIKEWFRRIQKFLSKLI